MKKWLYLASALSLLGSVVVGCSDDSEETAGTSAGGSGGNSEGGSTTTQSGGNGGTTSTNSGGSSQGGSAQGGNGTGGEGGDPNGCYAMLNCDPLAGTDCDDTPGAACDLDATNFTCYDPPNDAAIGEACDAINGPTCGHGSTCVNDVCRAFCCQGGDACAAGSCEEHPDLADGAPYDVWVCLP